MPLDREHETLSRQLQCLHDVIRRPGDNVKPTRHMFHALMMARIYDKFVDCQDRSQSAVGFDRYAMGLLLRGSVPLRNAENRN